MCPNVVADCTKWSQIHSLLVKKVCVNMEKIDENRGQLQSLTPIS